MICEVHRFGEGEVPDLAAYPDDPLCVDYAKRDITVADGGAIGFLVAEPARFVLALGKCRYWQQDHWSVQLAPRPGPADPVGRQLLVRPRHRSGRGPAHRHDDRRSTRDAGAGGRADRRRSARQLAAYFLAYAQGGDGASFAGGFPLNPLCSR